MWWDDWLKQVGDVACCTGWSSDMVGDVGKASKRHAKEGAGGVQMHKPAKAGAAKFENCRQAPTSHEYAEEGNVTVSSFIVSHGALSHLPLDQPEHDSHEDAGLQEAGNPTVVRACRPKLQRSAPPPPSGFMTPPQPVDITLTLGLEFSVAGSEGSQERSNFERTLVRELTQASGIPPEVQTRFVIKRLSPGSVVVDLSILADPLCREPTPATVAQVLEQQARTPTSMLRAGTLTRYAQAVHHRDTSLHLHDAECLQTTISRKSTPHATRTAPAQQLQLQPQPHNAAMSAPTTLPLPMSLEKIRARGAGVESKVGVGIVFDNRCIDGLKVSSLALDSPAFRSASIRAGDYLMEIDGRNVTRYLVFV